MQYKLDHGSACEKWEMRNSHFSLRRFAKVLWIFYQNFRFQRFCGWFFGLWVIKIGRKNGVRSMIAASKVWAISKPGVEGESRGAEEG